MRHLGDITKIYGGEIEPVDVIVGGSPCQDLSVAGKRAGLAGARSGLYMDQIRVVKEMRERDRNNGRTGFMVRPRYMLWENVPGAFSSNKGADFAAVLEEAIRIVEPEAPPVPVPPKGWPTSGCLYSDVGAWSLAWRVLDAQFWGVPQRRRRIALVVDFGGMSAPEILFEREGVRGDFAEGGTARQGTAADAQGGVGADDFARIWDARGNEDGLTANTITGDHERCVSDYSSVIVEPVVFDGANVTSPVNVQNPKPGDPCHTLNTDSRNYAVICLQGNGIDRSDTAGCNGKGWKEDVSYTLNTVDRPAVAYSMQAFGVYKNCGVASGLKARDYKDATDLVVAGVDCRNATEHAELNGTIQAKSNGGFSLNCNQIVRVHRIVRRLTPTECERLQGFPDGWTDIGEWIDSKGKVHKESSDSARYKALGNSIALPPWKYVLKRISAQYERDATMGSLFDGIGGFPLIWEQINGKGSARWASEIEEFPIAVTKRRFGEEPT